MGILVVADHDNAALQPATLNTIAAAAEIGGDIAVLLRVLVPLLLLKKRLKLLVFREFFMLTLLSLVMALLKTLRQRLLPLRKA